MSDKSHQVKRKRCPEYNNWDTQTIPSNIIVISLEPYPSDFYTLDGFNHVFGVEHVHQVPVLTPQKSGDRNEKQNQADPIH